MSKSNPGPNGDEKYLQRFIASIGIFLILISQLLVFSKPLDGNIIFPPYSWLTGLGLVVFVTSRFIKPTAVWKKLSRRIAPSRKVFWIGTAIALCLLTTVSISEYLSFTRINYIPIVSIWLLSAVCFVYAFSTGGLSVPGILNRLRDHRGEALALSLVTAVAAALRLYRLGSIPHVMDGDEGLVGLFAQQTTTGLLANPFAMWENIGALYLQGINIVFEIFGISLFSLRLLPALGGILAVPCLYLFARQIGGHRIALVASILLAVSHTHIHFSRIVSVVYIQGTWLVPLELYFLLSGLEKRNSLRTALGGILMGLHFTIYLTAQIIVGMLVVYFLIALLLLRKWFKPAIGPTLAFWGGFLIMFLPELVFIVNHPNEFMSRLGSDGTFQSGWLVETMELTGRSAAAILFERVIHAFLSLIYYPSIDFYGSMVPVLSVISTTLFLVGMLIVLIRTRQPKYLMLNGYFWGITVALGVFALPPSADSYRMLMVVPPAFIMAALGLEELLELLYLRWDNTRTAYLIGSGAVVLGIFMFNIWVYYGDFAGQCRYGGNIVGRFASHMGDYARVQDPDATIYLLSDTDFVYGTHASTDFLSLQREIINHPDPIDSLDVIVGDVIIASPNRIEELEKWAHDHPGGVLKSEYDCRTEILLGYRVP